jgi:glyoxylase-like metal-dependent hydrolase (beta-lactamase superfamily II)
MEYFIIPTGRVWVDPGGAFGLVPRSLWEKHHATNQDGMIAMDLNSLLVIDEGKTILIDTGLGTKLSEKELNNWNLEYPEGNLIENLEKQGYKPEDIDILINTHLHSDHCGGNTINAEDSVIPQFPNAEHYVQRIEWANLLNPSSRTKHTYKKENIVPVWKAGKINFLHGDAEITKNVHLKIVPGHSRANQVVIINDEAHPIIFMGDLASFAINIIKEAWVPAYDLEPQENIKSKIEIQNFAFENKALLIFQHDPYMRTGKLIKNEMGKWDFDVFETGSLSLRD